MAEPASNAALERAYLEDDRTAPWLFANMVTTIDGATAVDGRSSDIGDEQDTVVFRALRASADAIVVAAATARAEEYKQPRLPEHLLDWRRARGMADLPRIVLVTTSLEFDLEPFGDQPPIVVTSESSPAERRRRLEEATDVMVCGEGRVDLAVAISTLHDEGYGRLLSEGGPTLNGQLAAGGLVDEWCVTVVPLVVGGDSKRLAAGPIVADGKRSYRLDRALVGESSLFTRWLRNR